VVIREKTCGLLRLKMREAFFGCIGLNEVLVFVKKGSWGIVMDFDNADPFIEVKFRHELK
jgi:hypothetical protein